MVIGFIGVTGSGKSYFSKEIAKFLKEKGYPAEYLSMVSTREPRTGENISDKIFVSKEQFERCERIGLISASFEKYILNIEK